MIRLRRLLLVLVAFIVVSPLGAQQNLWQAKGITSPEVLDDNSVKSIEVAGNVAAIEELTKISTVVITEDKISKDGVVIYEG